MDEDDENVPDFLLTPPQKQIAAERLFALAQLVRDGHANDLVWLQVDDLLRAHFADNSDQLAPIERWAEVARVDWLMAVQRINKARGR